jgi:transcriptional regulator with XRE-family HTH domain
MSTVDQAVDLTAVRRLRHQHLIARLDYLRGLRQLAVGMTQSELARALGLTQPSISSALKSASKLADPRPGFSGATVYEIAQRFTAGRLARDQLIDELGRWDYEPQQTAGKLWVSLDGAADTMIELHKALRDGLLDTDTHQAIVERQRELSRHRREPLRPES